MIVYTQGALEDLERITEFHEGQEAGSVSEQLELILEAMTLLARHPELGRRVGRTGLRELIISRGKTGYLALYEYRPAQELIRVVAVRHQREAGYRGH